MVAQTRLPGGGLRKQQGSVGGGRARLAIARRISVLLLLLAFARLVTRLLAITSSRSSIVDALGLGALGAESLSTVERRAADLALTSVNGQRAAANISASDPWITLWRAARGRTLAPACLLPWPPAGWPEEDAQRFLTRNSVWEVREGRLCTVSNGYEFALRWRLDAVQHPREHEGTEEVLLPLGGANGAAANDTQGDLPPDVPRWNSTAAAARLVHPSCRYAGAIVVPHLVGWGGQWLETGMHLAEAALIFNQPTVLLPPPPENEHGPIKYAYAPNSTDCPADDWTCFVRAPTSCDAGQLRNGRGEWRAPYALFWQQKYIREARLADSRFLDVWDEVIADLGGGSQGLRGLAMMARAWATRPNLRMEREFHSILAGQGLLGDGAAGLEGCIAMHLRRSDNKGFHGRPVYSLESIVDAAREVIGPLSGRRLFLMSDTELGDKELGALSGMRWTMLHRYRGAANRTYADHLPTKNATLEVAYIFAEQELVSRCTSLVYQQGAFAGMLWEHVCRARGGWGVCLNHTSKVAMCDVCCSEGDLERGSFNVKEQSCNGRKIPDYSCPGVIFC